MNEIEHKKQEFIKAFRAHMGRDTRKVFAEKLKMSVQYVGSVINNKASLKLDAQIKIANALGMTLEDFLNYDKRSEEEPFYKKKAVLQDFAAATHKADHIFFKTLERIQPEKAKVLKEQLYGDISIYEPTLDKERQKDAAELIDTVLQFGHWGRAKEILECLLTIELVDSSEIDEIHSGLRIRADKSQKEAVKVIKEYREQIGGVLKQLEESEKESQPTELPSPDLKKIEKNKLPKNNES
ncbi:MAG: helix-turn-helix transcriptional regulator [Desulfobacterium sp.]|nr:helix-turn-helix transcriptional regulator [Desulfobacterium sp.]